MTKLINQLKYDNGVVRGRLGSPRTSMHSHFLTMIHNHSFCVRALSRAYESVIYGRVRKNQTLVPLSFDLSYWEIIPSSLLFAYLIIAKRKSAICESKKQFVYRVLLKK